MVGRFSNISAENVLKSELGAFLPFAFCGYTYAEMASTSAHDRASGHVALAQPGSMVGAKIKLTPDQNGCGGRSATSRPEKYGTFAIPEHDSDQGVAGDVDKVKQDPPHPNVGATSIGSSIATLLLDEVGCGIRTSVSASTSGIFPCS